MDKFIEKFVEIARAFQLITEKNISLGLISGLANELDDLSKKLKQYVSEQYAKQEDKTAKIKTIDIDF